MPACLLRELLASIKDQLIIKSSAILYRKNVSKSTENLECSFLKHFFIFVGAVYLQCRNLSIKLIYKLFF